MALVLAGCGWLDATGAPIPVGLEGTSWRAALIRDVAPIAGAEPTIGFEAGQAHGTTGCNTYGGAYHLDSSGGFAVESMIMTEMACDGPRGAQETVVIAVLSAADHLDLSGGQLRISGPQGSISFSRVEG